MANAGKFVGRFDVWSLMGTARHLLNGTYVVLYGVVLV